MIAENTDLFHVKKDVDSLPIAYVDTSDSHVDLKHGALILVSSLVKVSVAILLDKNKNTEIVYTSRTF